MTVGFHSPLPPAPGALRRFGRVEVAPGRCDVALHDAVLHRFLPEELAEAAACVRVGTALFGRRKKQP